MHLTWNLRLLAAGLLSLALVAACGGETGSTGGSSGTGGAGGLGGSAGEGGVGGAGATGIMTDDPARLAPVFRDFE